MLNFLDELALEHQGRIKTTESKWNSYGTYFPVLVKDIDVKLGDWNLNLNYEYRQNYMTKASAKQILLFGDEGFDRCDKHNILLRCKIDASKFNTIFTIQRKHLFYRLFYKKSNEKYIVQCKEKRFKDYLTSCKMIDVAYSEKGFNPLVQTWVEQGYYYISMGYEGKFGIAKKEALFTFELGKEIIKHIENFC
ncbi:hypothetical protein [Aureispira sp. CCB-E]|uniref:hypothetical protein n=1 Tax=Aureispira sp. CCB-E TaxID=3051121 RepID=UPI00286956A8|nr:hypothetical protein [Aureispira sp. CCB-E]WMX13737.1 hypothetical protein QP953_23075 [Aureispira sp. CCB-E]